MALTSKNATQQFVPVKEIRNGVIILKDGGYRGVLICSSVNFGLKSADEQHAIILGFQSFLNTLDFSIHIVIHSRKMDLRPYLAILAEKEPEQRTELMRVQLHEYIEFVRSFTDQTNIMTKSFYVIVPYAPHFSAASTVSFLQRLPGLSAGQAGGKGGESAPAKNATDSSFEEDRAQLEQRLTLVGSGLANIGVRAVPLGTEEVIELLYRAFNPGELENPIRLDN